jgi:hypothetical protein
VTDDRCVRCHCYHVDQPALLTALTDEAFIARYQQAIADELPSLADRALVRFLRRQTTLATRALTDGFDRLAEQDTAAADTLLTDLFAVATWHGWTLPIETLGERDLPVEDLPRGLLGADQANDGAKLWVIDQETIALARDRQADEPDLESHHRF